jgi:hypothetical protein
VPHKRSSSQRRPRHRRGRRQAAPLLAAAHLTAFSASFFVCSLSAAPRAGAAGLLGRAGHTTCTRRALSRANARCGGRLGVRLRLWRGGGAPRGQARARRTLLRRCRLLRSHAGAGEPRGGQEGGGHVGCAGGGGCGGWAGAGGARRVCGTPYLPLCLSSNRRPLTCRSPAHLQGGLWLARRDARQTGERQRARGTASPAATACTRSSTQRCAAGARVLAEQQAAWVGC